MNTQDEAFAQYFSSRRQFLGGCAALGTTSLLSTITQLQLTNSAVAALPTINDDYRALVCVFLFGGNDSFNMLAPLGSEYAGYSQARGSLALPQSDFLSIDGPNGRRFGINNSMPEIHDLYQDGQLSFLSNVGTLVQPIDNANQFLNGTRTSPRGLFSHNDQQQVWQTSLADRQTSTGWVGRIADILNDSVNTSEISMNISLGRTNILQNGNALVPYIVSPRGATVLRDYNPGSIFQRTTDTILDQQYQNVFKEQFRESRRSAIDNAIEFGQNIRNAQTQTNFPDSRLGAQLEMVARTMIARQNGSFSTSRQTFFVFAGGFDTHANLNDDQPRLLREVSQALGAFQRELRRQGLNDQVITYTASDFGRTLTSNGRGSDHAWGGNQILMGGPIRGGSIFGDYPVLSANSGTVAQNGANIDVGRGRLVPTTSVDELHAELAQWFGIPNDRNLEDVLPNIRNFYARGSNSLPIGFLRNGQI